MFENPEFLVLLVGIYLIAGFVKGVMGFGLPIITMSLLPFFVPIETAIVLSAVVQPATNILQFYQAKFWKDAVQRARPVLLALVPGVILGAWLLSIVESSLLLVLAGGTIFFHSIYQLVGKRFVLRSEQVQKAGLGLGFVAGVVGVLTSLNGWAFIIYLVASDVSRQVFRSTIALLFLVSGSMISGSFWFTGRLDFQLLLLGMMMLVPAFAGMWIGEQVGKRLSNERFKTLVLGALVLIGCVIMYRGLQ